MTMRLLYSGLYTGDLLGELPYLNASHNDTLNGEGSWSATIPFDDLDYLTIPDGMGGSEIIDRSGQVDMTGLTSGSTVVYFNRDGVILGSGILLGIALDYAAGTMELSGKGLGGYYQRRLMPTVTFTNTDQATIVKNLIDNYIEAAEYRGLGLEVPSVSTGILRTRQYDRNEAKPVYEAIEELASVQNGFDFRFRAQWDAGAIVRKLFIDYPATGRITDYVIELGVNAAVLNYEEDASQLTNVVLALGAGEGEDKIWRSGSHPATGEMPTLESAISHLDVNQTATLDLHISRYLQRTKQPFRRITVQLLNDTIPGIGSFEIGDRMVVKAKRGWLDVDDFFRITEFNYSIDDATESAQITLVSLDAFE